MVTGVAPTACTDAGQKENGKVKCAADPKNESSSSGGGSDATEMSVSDAVPVCSPINSLPDLKHTKVRHLRWNTWNTWNS